jgi:hypothetical protein
MILSAANPAGLRVADVMNGAADAVMGRARTVGIGMEAVAEAEAAGEVVDHATAVETVGVLSAVVTGTEVIGASSVVAEVVER